MTNVPATSPKIIRRKQLEGHVGLSRSAIYAKMKPNPNRPNDYDPTFPRPIRIGAKAVGWLKEEVDAWVDAQIAKSRA